MSTPSHQHITFRTYLRILHPINISPFGRIFVYSIPSTYSSVYHPQTEHIFLFFFPSTDSSVFHPQDIFVSILSTTHQYFTYRIYLPLLCPIHRLISISPTGHLRLHPIHIHLLVSISPTEHIFAFSAPSTDSSVSHPQGIFVSIPSTYSSVFHLRLLYAVHLLISISPTGCIFVFSIPSTDSSVAHLLAMSSSSPPQPKYLLG